MTTYIVSIVKRTAIIISTLVLIPVFNAQARSTLLEEIIVTAQKREQNIQDVGISVSAFSGSQIESFGWTTSEDIVAQTPGVQSSQWAGSPVSQYTIRGVGQGDYTQHQEAPNSVYIDEAYIALPASAGFPMFDLERTEILRGPQGTLFGRNATGGLIHFITKKPTEETEVYGKITAGERALFRVEGAAGGRLSDNLLGRLSLYFADSDGYIENTLGPDLKEEGVFAGRAQLLFNPSDDTSLLVNLHGFQQDVRAGIYQPVASFTDSDGVNQFAPAPGTDFWGYRDTDGDNLAVQADFTDNEGIVEKDNYGVTGKLTHEFNNLTLTAITDYATSEVGYAEDVDSTPNRVAFFNTTEDSSQFSQEVRLSGETDRLQWVVGGYYLNVDGDFLTNFGFPTLAGFFDPVTFPSPGGIGDGTGATGVSDWTTNTESWAVFGQGEWALNEQLTFISGIRWTEDSKDIRVNAQCVEEVAGVCTFDGFTGLGPNIVNGVNIGLNIIDIPGDINLSRTDSDWSGKVELDYKPNDDLLIYFSASKGIKGGGFTVPLDGLLPVVQLPYGAEKLFAYELGTKMTIGDGLGRVSASVFKYDYNDHQSFEFSNFAARVQNKDATNVGGEIEVAINPLEGVDLLFGGSYADIEVKGVTTPAGIQKQKPINAPELNLNWLARKTFPVQDWEVSLQYDGTYTDGRYFNVVNSPTVFAPSYTLHNVRLSVTDQSRKWEAALWVKNLGDEEWITQSFDLTILAFTLQKYAPPRWFGGSFKYTWQ